MGNDQSISDASWSDRITWMTRWQLLLTLKEENGRSNEILIRGYEQTNVSTDWTSWLDLSWLHRPKISRIQLDWPFPSVKAANTGNITRVLWFPTPQYKDITRVMLYNSDGVCWMGNWKWLDRCESNCGLAESSEQRETQLCLHQPDENMNVMSLLLGVRANRD